MRIHALPHSKRYASTRAEGALILRRQNILAQVVLRPGAPCWLVATRYQVEAPPKKLRGTESLPIRFALSMPTPPEFREDEPEMLNIWCARVRWQPHAFDPLLEAIANNSESRVLFAAERSARIFAPYDGGVDVIAANPIEGERLKRQFRSWLSQRPDGL